GDRHPQETHIAEPLRPRRAVALAIPLELDPLTRLRPLPVRPVQEVVLLDSVPAPAPRLAGTEEQRVERLALPPLEVLVRRVVHRHQRVLRGERFEVVLELVRQRLPQLVLPVEPLVQPGEPQERAVIQHDHGPRRVRSAVVGEVVLRDALAERVDVRQRGVRLRGPLHHQPGPARLAALGDPPPDPPGTILEIVETQVRSSPPDPSPGRGGGAPPPLPPPGRGRGSPFRPSPLELRVWVGESPPPRPSTREAALPRPATRVGELRVN